MNDGIAVGAPPRVRKPTIRVLLLAFFGIGTAYLYLGRPRRAAAMVAACLAFLTIFLVGPPVAFQGPVVLVIVIAGFVSANVLFFVDMIRLARRGRPDARAWFQRWYFYVAWATASALATVPFAVLREAHLVTLEPFSMPSRTMVPTLDVGDRFMAVMRAWRDPTIGRGDVVIYRRASGTGETLYAHRVVALPGETVQMTGGRLVIDGTEAAREDAGRYAADTPNGTVDAPMYREQLPGGVVHLVIEISGDTGPLDDTRPITLPLGSYFVLGDNRDLTRDSRLSGPVPAADILGRAFAIYWSTDLGRIGRGVE